MRAYLFAVAGTVIISAIVTAIAPEGKLSATVKTAAKLVCLIVIAQPIPRYVVAVKNGETSEFFDKTVLSADDDFIKYCSKIKVAAAEQAVETEIYQTYAVRAKAEFCWNVSETTDEIEILEVCLTFGKEAAEQAETIQRIQRELSEKYGVDVSWQIAAETAET